MEREGADEGRGKRVVGKVDTASTFGAMLREYRSAAGLTQEELATKAGLTSKAVSVLERGERKRPYPHTVRSLAEALGLSEAGRASLLAAVPGRGNAAPPVSAPPTPAFVPPMPLAPS